MGDGTSDRRDRMALLMEDLYPICRSIMGPGTRTTLDRITAEIELQRHRLPSGAQVLDWTVPDEWIIDGASITRVSDGHRVVDFRTHNLHVVSHSEPIDVTMTLDELQQHLHSLPDRPHAIPYRTSYYARSWGFCLAHHEREQLKPGEYHVVIDSSLTPGHLEWGEVVIPGASDQEVLLTTHICHPSLANDNLTGIAALVELARHLRDLPQRRFTYRLLFLPGTIGSIAWLATSPAVGSVAHGLVVTGLGDSSPLTYKCSRRGDVDVDRLAGVILGSMEGSRVVPFTPYGYDERQFCSPGFDLPIGRLTRGVHGEYPEYHTSADDLDFIVVDRLEESVDVLIAFVRSLESNRRYVNTSPRGEPQLGRRGLYSNTGGAINQKSIEMAYLWVLSGSDGRFDLCEIASRAGLPMDDVITAAQRLFDVGLLEDLS